MGNARWKMAFYTGIVDKLKLTDDEIAAIMGHEMTHALHEHGKNKVGQQILTNTAAQIGTQIILDKNRILIRNWSDWVWIFWGRTVLPCLIAAAWKKKPMRGE